MSFVQKSHRRDIRTGHSLAELLVATATASVLVGGLASSLYLSGVALQPDNASQNAVDAARVLATLRDDLRHATRFTSLTDHAATFTVPDRDADGNQETLRYEWSGVPGDPLFFEYNQTGQLPLLASVQSFELTSLTRRFFAEPLTTTTDAVKLLFVVSNEASVTPNESLLHTLFQAWGYEVSLLSESVNRSSYDNAIAANAVVVLSGDCTNASNVGASTVDAGAGIVSFLPDVVSDLGIAQGNSLETESSIRIDNDTHPITESLALGTFEVIGTPAPLNTFSPPLAAGADTLATILSGGLDRASLVTIEAGEPIRLGGAAAGRRVMLPFGGAGFDADDLTSNGQTLVKNALAWASERGSVGAGVQFLAFEEAKGPADVTFIDIPTPAGAAGDLLVAAVATDSNTANQGLGPTASGWTQVALNNNSSNVTLGVWWRIATASDPATFRFQHTDSEDMYGWIMRFSGHHPTSPINVFSTGTGSSSTPDAPAVTTTVDNTMIVRMFGADDDDANVDDAGMTDHTTITVDNSDSGSGTCSGGAAYATQAAAGDSGVAEFTLAGSEQHVTVTIAIAPEPAP